MKGKLLARNINPGLLVTFETREYPLITWTKILIIPKAKTKPPEIRIRRLLDG